MPEMQHHWVRGSTSLRDLLDRLNRGVPKALLRCSDSTSEIDDIANQPLSPAGSIARVPWICPRLTCPG
jgi:hypothetical protein